MMVWTPETANANPEKLVFIYPDLFGEADYILWTYRFISYD